MNSSEILARLRQETLAEHKALEGSLNLMDDGLTSAGYVTTLRQFHGFVLPWEKVADKACPHHLRPFFQQRRRAHRIAEDMLFFDAEPSPGLPELPAISSPGAFLGTMYVMEGSTLGGQFISRHLERVLGLRDGVGYSYFRGYGAETSTMWKEFCAVLSREAEPMNSAEIITAAAMTFRAFGTWLSLNKEAPSAASYGLQRSVP
jgi:heme oxygenase